MKSLEKVDIKKINEKKILLIPNKLELINYEFVAYESDKHILSYDYLKLKLDYEKVLLDFKKIKDNLNLEIKFKINSLEWVEFKEKAATKDLDHEQILRNFIRKFNEVE